MIQSSAFCTVKEFSKLLKVHPNTVLNSIKKGRIQAFRISNGPRASYRIPFSEIQRLCMVDMNEIIDKMVQDRMKG